MSEKKQETICLHEGQETADTATGARAVPIYLTTSYVFKSPEHAANLFALKEFGNIYTRIMNPTTDVFERRVAAIEGGSGALAVSSGQAATTFGLLNLTQVGDEVLSANNLYGGTYQLFHYTFPKLGRSVKFVESTDPSAFARDTSTVMPLSMNAPDGFEVSSLMYNRLSPRTSASMLERRRLVLPSPRLTMASLLMTGSIC